MILSKQIFYLFHAYARKNLMFMRMCLSQCGAPPAGRRNGMPVVNRFEETDTLALLFSNGWNDVVPFCTLLVALIIFTVWNKITHGGTRDYGGIR